MSESRFLEKGFLVLSYYSLRDASFALLVLLHSPLIFFYCRMGLESKRIYLRSTSRSSSQLPDGVIRILTRLRALAHTPAKREPGPTPEPDAL